MTRQEEISRLWEERSWAALTDDWAAFAKAEEHLAQLGALEAQVASPVPAGSEGYRASEGVDIHAAPDWF